MFSNKDKENSTEKELEEIRDLVETNNKILLSQLRSKKMKLIFQLAVILGLVYLGYYLWTNNASKVSNAYTEVEEKIESTANKVEKVNSALDKILSIFGSDSEEEN